MIRTLSTFTLLLRRVSLADDDATSGMASTTRGVGS
jgi:hypothetical protein